MRKTIYNPIQITYTQLL
uniref:Uncharacterized protein n=1 Tax=Anguilla anguilla TaxID=7936 RepID=A0A0E9WLE8_ANGAN